MKATFAANATKSMGASHKSSSVGGNMENDPLNRHTRPWTSPEPLLPAKTFTGKPPGPPPRGKWNTKLGRWEYDDPARNRQFHHTYNCGLTMRVTEPSELKPSNQSYSMYLCPSGSQAGAWTSWRDKERSEAIRWKGKKPVRHEDNFTMAANTTHTLFKTRQLSGTSSAPSLYQNYGTGRLPDSTKRHLDVLQQSGRSGMGTSRAHGSFL